MSQGHGGGVESGIGYFFRAMVETADPTNWEVVEEAKKISIKKKGGGGGGGAHSHGGGH